MSRIGRPPVMSADERKEAIYSAAENMLREINYDKITMAGIAKSAGMSKKTLYQYFESKEELLRGLISSSYIWPESDLDTDHRDHPNRLRACLRFVANHVLSQRHITLCRLAIGNGLSAENFSNTFLQMGIGRGRESVIQTIKDIPPNRLALKLPPEVLSSMLYGSTSGPQLMNALLTGKQPDLEQVYQTIDQVVDQFLLPEGPDSQ